MMKKLLWNQWVALTGLVVFCCSVWVGIEPYGCQWGLSPRQNIAQGESLENQPFAIPPQALRIQTSHKFPRRIPRAPYPMMDDGPRGAAPMGGLGTGSFQRNLDGQLTGFRFSATAVKEVLPQGQIAIYERRGNQPPVATPLGKRPENDSRLSSWDWKQAEQTANKAIYYGLYPYSWWKYAPTEESPAEVTLRQFSPLIMGDIKTSSLPVAMMEVELMNPTDEEIEVSVMVSMPNVAGWRLVAEEGAVGGYHAFEKSGESQSHRLREDEKYLGIVMGINNPSFRDFDLGLVDLRLAGKVALVTEKREDVEITYHTAFDVQGSGEEVWTPFAKNGSLTNNRAVTTGSREQAGALAVKIRLKPGERRVVPFTFAWDFPYDVRNGLSFAKYYTNRYGTSRSNTYPIATLALKERLNWVGKIDRWQSVILNDEHLPEPLKTMLINELYFLAAGGSLFSDTAYTRGYLEAFYLEGWDFRIHSTSDVWFYTPMFAHFFPDLEKRLIEEFARLVVIEDDLPVEWKNPFPSRYYGYAEDKPEYDQALAQGVGFDPNRVYLGALKLKGAVPHHLDDFVLGPISEEDDPFAIGRGFNRYWQNHNAWKDLSPKFVLMAWRAYQLDGAKDIAFLKEVWQAIVETLAYQRQFDRDNDGLPDHEGFPDWTYDTWVVKGATTYTAILTMQALEAALKIGKLVGDQGHEEEYQEWLRKGKESIQQKLWNEEGNYFNISQESTDIMADALAGIAHAHLYGLPLVVEPEQVRKHLEKVYEYNFKKYAQGRIGVVNGMSADGRTLGEIRGDIQADKVWIGVQRLLIALMLFYGMSEEANEILQVDFENTWRGGYQYRTPEAIDAEGFIASTYMRAGAAWSIFEAIQLLKQDSSRIQSRSGLALNQSL